MTLGIGGCILIGGAVLTAIALGRWMTGWLGRLTGDAYGDINEKAEVVVLTLGVALW